MTSLAFFGLLGLTLVSLGIWYVYKNRPSGIVNTTDIFKTDVGEILKSGSKVPDLVNTERIKISFNKAVAGGRSFLIGNYADDILNVFNIELVQDGLKLFIRDNYNTDYNGYVSKFHYNANQWYNLTLDFERQRITIYLDDKQVDMIENYPVNVTATKFERVLLGSDNSNNPESIGASIKNYATYSKISNTGS